MLKDRLLQDWWAQQCDGSLYGRILIIPLSHLGPQSSHRTDQEMRQFMSAYGIAQWQSAASVDLRQHKHLDHAVHNALYQAEAWDKCNYRQGFSGRLNLDVEGGFYLASTQPQHLVDDSRFASFKESTSLYGAMHTVLWRYKQLTGREFLIPNCTAVEGAGMASYHDAWCAIRRQIFIPYFLRFRNPVEAVAWMPELGMLRAWTGGAENWQTSDTHVHNEFGCRDDGRMESALNPTLFKYKWGWADEKKGVLPLACVDLPGIDRDRCMI